LESSARRCSQFPLEEILKNHSPTKARREQEKLRFVIGHVLTDASIAVCVLRFVSECVHIDDYICVFTRPSKQTRPKVISSVDAPVVWFSPAKIARKNIRQFRYFFPQKIVSFIYCSAFLHLMLHTRAIKFLESNFQEISRPFSPFRMTNGLPLVCHKT
jgi:hypothetical protein